MYLSDKELLRIAYRTAKYSRDPRTKVGAILARPNPSIADSAIALHAAYNDLPFKVRDMQSRREKPFKFLYTEHAERLAIYTAAQMGTVTFGLSMYCTGHPCADCARAIVCAGILRLVVHTCPEFALKDTHYAGMQILEETGVEVSVVSSVLGETVLHDGVMVNV